MTVDQGIIIAALAGLGGMLGWGLADFFAKKTIDEIGDVTSLALAHLTGTAAFLIIVAGKVLTAQSTQGLPGSGGDWFGVMCFGALQAAVYILVYRGFGKGQLALLNPMFASFSGIAALISIIAFGEAVSGHVLIALAVTFGGVLLLNLDPVALFKRRIGFARIDGFVEIAGATVLAAIWTVLWGRFAQGHDAVFYAALMYLFMTGMLLIYAFAMKVPLRVGRRIVWLYLALIGLCETGAYLAVTWGYATTTHLSIVALVSGAFSLPAIILARAFLKERTTWLQGIASLVIVGGILLLNSW